MSRFSKGAADRLCCMTRAQMDARAAGPACQTNVIAQNAQHRSGSSPKLILYRGFLRRDSRMSSPAIIRASTLGYGCEPPNCVDFVPKTGCDTLISSRSTVHSNVWPSNSTSPRAFIPIHPVPFDASPLLPRRAVSEWRAEITGPWQDGRSCVRRDSKTRLRCLRDEPDASAWNSVMARM